MQNEKAKGITNKSLIRKYVDKFMDIEVSEFYRVEEYEGKKHYMNSVMNTYLKKDVALNFVDKFFEGHCSYAEMLLAVMEEGKKAVNEEQISRKQLQKEQRVAHFYGRCTAEDCYYWAIEMIAAALLQYAECSLFGQMFCDINIEAMGKYVGVAKRESMEADGKTIDPWARKHLCMNFFFFEKINENMEKDVRSETMGEVIRQLLQQVGSSWKCGAESLSDYRNRIRSAQRNLERILYAALATIYPERFQVSVLQNKYAVRTNMDQELENRELCGGI